MVAISVWVLTAYRRVDIALLPPLVSGGGETVESLARETTPCLISLPLPLFLLHSPSTRWTTSRNGVLSRPQHPPLSNSLSSVTPNLENLLQEASCLATSLRVHRRGVNGASVAESLPEEATAIGESRKTTETAHSSLATAYACTIPGGRHPAKFGCQPIKL